MSRKRRVLGAGLQSKVALAAVRGDKTTAQLASQFGVHISQVTAWKKRLLAGELFADGRRRKKDEQSASEEELFEQIGRLKMEVEWLKKVGTAGRSTQELKSWIARDTATKAGGTGLSIARRCALLGLPRSTCYYEPQGGGLRTCS